MAEEKENKSSTTVRLSGELLAELRKEQAPYLARGEEAPSFGALLHKAWKTYKSLAEIPADQLSDLLVIAETLNAPDSTETRPLKSQIKVMLNELEKRKAAEKTSRPSPHDQRRKSGT